MRSSTPEIEHLRDLSCRELMAQALETKLSRRGGGFSLCSIINAKSGGCTEDCKFCTQSAHFKTGAPVYPLKPVEEIVAAAMQAKHAGASHFSIVASGRRVTDRLLSSVADIIRTVKRKVDIHICASLGIATRQDLAELKQAGLSRYHHNLETSREFFPSIVTTHTFEERIATIAAAREAGLEVCAGGIIGLGESERDRISMAVTLAQLHVDSVPLNILMPLPGTPLAGASPLSIHEILRAIALIRLILPDAALRLAAGRETALNEFLGSAFLAGADGMMIGGYLTQRGRSVEKDRAFVDSLLNLWR